MSLPLGKLGILVGAGIVGSVLAKEGRMPGVSDILSGAFQIALKPLKQSDSSPSSSKPKSDALMAQINSLRQELQLLSGGRSITIVTSGSRGGRPYGIIIVIVVAGYGYIWWKGWKLPDLSFATRRGLSDACSAIAKQLEQVYSSLSATRRDLSRKIERVDCSLNDCTENIASTQQEVTELQGEVKTFGDSFQSVRHVVKALESRVSRMQGKEEATHVKVMKLVNTAKSLEGSAQAGFLQGSSTSASRPALEHPQMTTSSRAVSLPPCNRISLEPPSPSSNGNDEVHQQPLKNTLSASGLKELEGVADAVEAASTPSPRVVNGVGFSGGADGPTGSTIFGRRIYGNVGSFITRSRSAATQSFK
uniref:BZIP9 n=1 Tax=Tamarix hispida TaxID=189793 RepID=I7C786_9CARY|nr:bZIP9 [Tamarix hispida]